MSKEIDEKVVSMKFDHKNFMDNTAETMTRLEKLKASLRLPGAAKGMEDVGNAANDIKLSPLGAAAEQVGLKFNALQVMAATALANITNSAVNAGKRIVSALTIEPIKMGFQEYETQINAVQTILANTESKGTTLDDVNKALDELNTYADKTIYNFTEMTRNIGTFTAAGVDLDTSVNAIQGIANLAAVSGSSSQQASTAMYQLSQALSSGTVKLMDWNSVVNAGMGGQVFQDALKETARVHDIAIDDMIEEQGSFRETLSEGWLTADILTETLSHFTMAAKEGSEEWNNYKKSLMSDGYTEEQAIAILKLSNNATDAATKVKTFTQLMDTLKEAAQSGWTQTWEILVGDFEEAKQIWGDLYNVFSGIINASAEARNALLKGWKDGGGRDDLKESFVNVWQALLAIIKPIKEAFREIFPPTTAEQLLRITEAIKNFTSKLILSEHAQDKLKSTFKGLFAVLDIGVHIFKEIGKGAMKVLGALLEVFVDLTGGINNATGSFGDWLVGIRDSIKNSTLLTTIISGVVTVLLKLVDGLKRVVTYIKESKILNNIVSGIATTFRKLGEVIKTVYSYLKENVRFPSLEGFLAVLTAIWNGIKFVFGKIKESIGSAGSAFMDAFRQGDFKRALEIFNGGIVAGILLGIKKFINGFSDFQGGISGVIESVSGVLDSVRGCFEAYQSRIQAATLMEIAKAIALLTVAIIALTFVDKDKLGDSLATLVFLFGGLLGTMAVMTRMGGGIVQVYKATSTIISMSIAVLLLASALRKIAKIDIKEMGAAYMGLLGLAGIVVLFTKVVGRSLNAQKKTAIVKYSSALLAFALGLRILTTVCKELGQTNPVELIKGLAAVAALMTGISLFIKKTSMNKKMHETMKGILSMSIAIGILALSTRVFANMDWTSLAKGLTGVVTLLFSLALALRVMPKDINRIFIGLLGTVVAISALSQVVTSLGGMSIDAIGRGLLALGGSLAILAISLNLMKGTLTGSTALLVAAVALNLIAIPLRILGAMNLTSIGIALLAIAGTFAVFGVSALLLAPLVPVITALSTAIALLGIGVLGVGLGLTTFASGLLVLAGVTVPAAAAIVAALGVILTGVIGLGAVIAGAVATLISGICSALVTSIGAICKAVSAIIIAVCDALIISVPKILECVGVLLDALLGFILQYAPKLVGAGIALIAYLLDGIAQNIGLIVEKAVLVVTKFLEGLGSQVESIISAAFDLILELINGIARAIETYTPLLLESCVNLGVAIIKGIVKGLVSVPGIIWNAIKDVAQGIKDKFKECLGINSPAKEMIPIGQGIDEGVVVGLEKYKGLVVDATEDVGKTAVDSMSNAIAGISDAIDTDIDSQPTIRPVLDLSNIESGAGLINGMFGMTPSVDVLSNVGSISSTMNNRQNGDSDILSAIKDLGLKIGEMGGDVYNVNGVTYDDGSNVADAVKSLVRAARIERRIN